MRSSLLVCLLMGANALAQGDLVGLLQTQPDLSTLLDLVSLVPNLANILSGSSNITILAPTNEAFANIPADIPEGLAVNNRNVTSIAALLANHVLQGAYPSSGITEVPTFVRSLLNSTYMNDIQPFTNTTGGQYIGAVKNGMDVNFLSGEFQVSRVIQPDLKLGDGITIHVIDQALLFGAPLQLYTARAGLFALNSAFQAAGLDNSDGIDSSSILNFADKTFFLPTDEAFELIGSVANSADEATLRDVLSYHVLDGNIVFSPSISNSSVQTLQGNELALSLLDDGSIFVNNAKVVLPNVILWNGVAHIIDNVLNPEAPVPNRESLNAETPASERVEFLSATPTSALDFTTFSIPTSESYTIPAIYTTGLLIGPPASATPTPSVPPFEGDASRYGIAGVAAGMALVAGGYAIA